MSALRRGLCLGKICPSPIMCAIYERSGCAAIVRQWAPALAPGRANITLCRLATRGGSLSAH